MQTYECMWKSMYWIEIIYDEIMKLTVTAYSTMYRHANKNFKKKQS